MKVESSELGLAWAIHPICGDVFFADHYEAAPLIISRQDINYYSHLLSVDVVDHLLPSLDRSNFRMVNDGEVVPADGLVLDDGHADVEKILNEFHRGATLILEGLQRRYPPLALFCRNLEKLFAFDVQANVYFTPKRSQGFKAHFDTHDVFVLQLEGAKHWRIYDSPIRLPLKTQQVTVTERSSEPGPILNDFILSPGDCAYIPRGFLHDATASGEASLHITIGLKAYTWSQALIDMILQYSHQDVELRSSVILPSARREGDELRLHFRRLIRKVMSVESFERVVDAAHERFCRSRRPLLHGHLRSLLTSEAISLTTWVRRRPGVVFRIRVDDGGIGISFHGKEIVVPKFAGPEICSILRDERPFTVESMDGYCDPEGKLTLIRRLINEGFLEVVCVDGAQ